MELETSQVESTPPKVDGQEVKLPQRGLKQTRINFAKKTVMPTFVKKNAVINAVETEKQSSGVIDLTSKGGPIKIISDTVQHKKDKQFKQSKKQLSKNKAPIKKNATSLLTKKSIFIEDDSDNEEVPLSVIKKQLSSGMSPLKNREEKTVKIISASEKEKECTVNDILKKIDKDGVKVLKVQKVDNKDNTDKRDILSNNKLIPNSSNSSRMLTSACLKQGGQAVPLKLPINVSKIPIQITNKLTFSNTQKQIISPLQTVASRQIVPAKSVVIAIDMDPETWKKLSPQEQAKIIADKKEAARKHLLTLTGPTSLKILSPVRPIIPVGKPVVTKLSAQPRLPTTIATAGGTVSVSQMTQMLNQQHFMPLERRDDLELVGLKNLPIAKQVKMPLGLANKMFGDIAMIVVFVNTFKKFLSPEDQQNMTAEKLMDGLSADGGAANVILNILLLFLKVVLTSDDYKVKGLKIELADLPLTEYSASYLTEQFLKSQIEKKKRQKKALEMAQAAALAVEKAELGNELNESIDEENVFLQSDDEEWESHKKKKKKSELACNTEEYQLKTISAQLESNEFHQMNTCDQLTVLTYMLHIILESEDFSFHYDELEDDKLKLYRELESCRKERMKLKREKEEMQRLATIDNFIKSAQTKEENVDSKDVKEVDSQKQTEISAFSGMTQRQIDAIKAEGEKEAQKKKELEMEKMEAAQREENKISMELKKMIAICRSALRLQPLGMDRYCRTYWMFSKEIPGIFVCSGGVATSSLNLVPPPVTKVERWAQYTTKEEIDSLISSLTSRGVREFQLRNALKANYNNVITALNKTPVIEGESKPAEKYSATNASVNALKEDLIESANRIVHGSLGDLRVDLEEWTSNVKAINDISKLKEYMLQIQKSILPKYYTSPFDAGSNDISTEWCKIVDKAKTLSFLHTLFGILENSVQWDMSAENMRCNACRKKTMKNGHLIRCDECENGYHSLCLKPPLLTIPQGVWTCPKCLALAAKKAQEIEQQFQDALNSDHEDLCHVCETDGHMILCDTCPLSYHFECHNPPLRRVPRGAWSCYECRNLPSRKRRRKNDSTECSENDESADDNSCDNDKAFTKTSKRKFKKKENEILNNKKTKNSSQNAVNSKHKNSTSKNSRNNISKRKGRSAKSSGEEWDNEEEADDEEESWKSNTSPILGNKRPRYVKDCSNRKLKKNSQHSSTDVELKSNKQKSAPNKAHTNTRKAAFSARSQRRAGRSSRGNNYELKACREILMGLRRHESAWPFLSPVDLDKAPQYLELISKPMDFTLILKKLDMLEYEDVLHFIEDVKTVFDNSKSYNSNSSEIGQAGVNLARVFDMLLKENLPEIYTTFNKEEETS